MKTNTPKCERELFVANVGDLTLGELRKISRRRGMRFFVYCAWTPNEGTHFRVSMAEFFRAIGEGESDDLPTAAWVGSDGYVYIN